MGVPTLRTTVCHAGTCHRLNWTLASVTRGQAPLAFTLDLLVAAYLAVESVLDLLLISVRLLIDELWHHLVRLKTCSSLRLTIRRHFPGNILLGRDGCHVIILWRVYHLLRLLNLLSSNLWKNLDCIRIHCDARLLFRRRAPIKAMWTSHRNRLDCFLATGAWSCIALRRLVHSIESFAVQLWLKLLRNADLGLGRMG